MLRFAALMAIPWIVSVVPIAAVIIDAAWKAASEITPADDGSIDPFLH
jgi:hypothetical protein